MLYLNKEHIMSIEFDWSEIVECLKEALHSVYQDDYVQPVKLYLRYKNPDNRIIAMPAYLGGNINLAGIKWIASFPQNINKGIDRANSIIVLNEADTGKPLCTINTSVISSIRTAGVTAMVITELFNRLNIQNLINFGIVGFGPIGQMHLGMILSLFKDKIQRVFVFDILKKMNWKTINVNTPPGKVTFKSSWDQVYKESKVFITCTVSNKRYINIPPKPGTLLMNISLRDYQPKLKDYMDIILVDDWVEVCRENTDIEMMNNYYNLQKKDIFQLSDLLFNSKFPDITEEDTVMFNPMGMAIFDIAIAQLFYKLANAKGLGINLK